MSQSIRFQGAPVQSVAALVVFAGAAALLLGGAHPVAVGLVPTPWDKLAHVAVYAVLACAVGLASGRSGVSTIAIGFFAAMAIGVTDELLQLTAVGRSADLEDLLADAVGAALGTLPLAVLVHRRQMAREHDHPLSNG
jgi:VanZ family protein